MCALRVVYSVTGKLNSRNLPGARKKYVELLYCLKWFVQLLFQVYVIRANVKSRTHKKKKKSKVKTKKKKRSIYFLEKC